MGEKQGLLVAVEGFDGSGKSTIVRQTLDELVQKGYSAVSRKPLRGNRSFVSEMHYLREKCNLDVDEFMASYFGHKILYHTMTEILPDVTQGEIVLCDRYLYSHLANQHAFGVEAHKLSWLVESLPKPDLTFYLDVPIESALKRLGYREVPGVGDNADFLVKAKGEFDALCAKEGFIRLDGTTSPSSLVARIARRIIREVQSPKQQVADTAI